MVVGNIFFEGRGGFVFPALYFNWDNLSAILQHEINFMIFYRRSSGGNFELLAKLLQTIIFSQRPLELVVRIPLLLKGLIFVLHIFLTFTIAFLHIFLRNLNSKNTK